MTAALTLRHRIPDTAVNSLEAYLHPRQLAFAAGLVGIAVFLRGRTWLAVAAVTGALLLTLAKRVSRDSGRWIAYQITTTRTGKIPRTMAATAALGLPFRNTKTKATRARPAEVTMKLGCVTELTPKQNPAAG